MPISVECPCGRTYVKPDRKVGSTFRCHVCGRELTVDGVPSAEGSPHNESSQQVTDKPSRRARKPRVTADDAELVGAPRTQVSRSIAAWVLIVLGLLGVVGGAGQYYIHTLIEKALTEDANAKNRMFGDLQPPGQAQRHGDRTALAIAGGEITVGLLLFYLGCRIRHS